MKDTEFIRSKCYDVVLLFIDLTGLAQRSGTMSVWDQLSGQGVICAAEERLDILWS